MARGERLLPCDNAAEIVAQIEPTIDLLQNLPRDHPDVLRARSIDPDQYHEGQVFRSAIETIRGQQAARQTAPREGFVRDILSAMQRNGLVTEYAKTPTGTRWDFDATLTSQPVRQVAIEVKGGEGNSLNISNRPEEVAEFVVWCHLDGSLKHRPGRGVQQIVGRIVADIVKSPKRIDALIIRDVLCGSKARPCPKYVNQTYPALGPAPDVFLFPSAALRFGSPTQPKSHTQDTIVFPFRLLDLFGVSKAEMDRHIHYVDIRLYYDGDKPMRELVIRQGQVEQFRHSATVAVRP